MLRMARQNGPTCLAFALYNAGIVDEAARDEYVNTAIEGRAKIRQRYGRYMDDDSINMIGSLLSPNLIAGTREFAKPWLMKYAPKLYRIINDSLWGAQDALRLPAAVLAQQQQANHSVPSSGKGTLLLSMGRNGSHIVAYEDGRLVDSDKPIPTYETWEEFSARLAFLHPKIIRIIPNNEVIDE